MTYGIRIPKEAKPLIRKELKQFFGIHTGSIYPEIVNLVDEISNKSRKLNTEKICCCSELMYAVRMLEKELDYYFDYVLDNRKELDTEGILVYVENRINSSRIGLLDFTQNMEETIQKAYLSEEELNTIINQYNQLILEFSKELNQHGVHKFSGGAESPGSCRKMGNHQYILTRIEADAGRFTQIINDNLEDDENIDLLCGLLCVIIEKSAMKVLLILS